ncbi:dTDP-Rha:alpha-D-GlcNAc-pyrophosphate polyprenol, alpha-3-L-rhamnosyltransferase [Chryseobacterium gleum]|uniref:dTDP-Rha:alpha-D-GlcNAc-pyrophosphate polyprenol, alpha-3-L-rhamnosyltransferase n=2 Tax=Chryseobacterium gleum TaxID=250 RepID=A0A3S4NSC9_CHRGE|nr:glycosyltransferase family 2 protein [Chryseobacterium gleum]EFK34428.1 glycosyltransferase, group 2 family protein [Chryseobacterium gleum ATCC 35910]QQY30279.1 glycosyltransferase family 2 protein [Chryseobacterium gleum]VEE05401.1 dTDP-Rha:alpha-D-GlcNAc-pyrophosphate polyprenol, alpha-3-L-rhamnosyltransferase [Chryseobacterium gleum]
MQKKLAVAILNWNGRNWLEQFLPGVVQFSQNADIYVIDNLSTDDSIEFLEKHFPTVQIVKNDKNYGFAGGYNEGLKAIKNEYYCLLNSDVEVTENWTEPVLELLESNPSVSAVQPKILSYHNRNYFEFAGAAGGLIDNLGYPYCRGRVFDDLEEDKGQYNDEAEICWASGCCFFIRSKDFWEQSGFDARFFAHQEEIDLCWRLINSGKKIYYTGKSQVYHVGGGTLNKQSAQKTYLNMRNNLSMLLKNLPFPQVIWVIFFRLCLDGIAGVYFGIKYGFSHLWAVLRAHFAFYSQIPGTWKLRQSHQKKNFYQSKWLIFKHFLRGRS